MTSIADTIASISRKTNNLSDYIRASYGGPFEHLKSSAKQDVQAIKDLYDRLVDPSVLEAERVAEARGLRIKKSYTVRLRLAHMDEAVIELRSAAWCLPATSFPLHSSVVPSQELSEWIEVRRSLDEDEIHTRDLARFMRKMNTLGQVDRLWPEGATELIDRGSEARVKAQHRRSKWPKGFVQPKNLDDLRRSATKLLDLALLMDPLAMHSSDSKLDSQAVRYIPAQRR